MVSRRSEPSADGRSLVNVGAPAEPFSVGAEVEVIPIDRVNEAYERVLASDVRFRFVIDAATLR